MKRALITGITGQDGSYLADILTEQGCEVHGLYRHSSVPAQMDRIAHLEGRITLHSGDVTDPMSVLRIVEAVQPDEVYHEADQDHIGFSKITPAYTVAVTVGGAVNVLEAVRKTVLKCRVFLPGSATMFLPSRAGLSETSIIAPDSPYACAKEHVYRLARYYRQEHGMFVACGILFSHDSIRRSPDHLLQRIARAAAAKQRTRLTDVGQLVDVGYAREYMECAVLALRAKEPADYVIGSGVGVSVWQIARSAYCHAGLDDSWIDDVNTDRPSRGALLSDPQGALYRLGWQARTSVFDLVCQLVDHHSERAVT